MPLSYGYRAAATSPPQLGTGGTAGATFNTARRRVIRQAARALILKSVALVLELGGRLHESREAEGAAASIETEVARPPYRAVVRAAAALVVVFCISVAILITPIDYDALGEYGYLGVFVVTLLTTGAFVLPVPYLVLIGKAGTFLNPAVVALVAGVAAALGELTGYLVGFGGRELLGRQDRWQRAATRWMERRGFLTVAVFAFIPNPVFDAAGIAAGALRYAVWKFALACFIGKTAKFFLIALLGAQF